MSQEEEEIALAEIEAEREADRRRSVLREAAEWLCKRGRVGLAERMLEELK